MRSPSAHRLDWTKRDDADHWMVTVRDERGRIVIKWRGSAKDAPHARRLARADAKRAHAVLTRLHGGRAIGRLATSGTIKLFDHERGSPYVEVGDGMRRIYDHDVMPNGGPSKDEIVAAADGALRASLAHSVVDTDTIQWVHFGSNKVTTGSQDRFECDAGTSPRASRQGMFPEDPVAMPSPFKAAMLAISLAYGTWTKRQHVAFREPPASATLQAAQRRELELEAPELAARVGAFLRAMGLARDASNFEKAYGRR